MLLAAGGFGGGIEVIDVVFGEEVVDEFFDFGLDLALAQGDEGEGAAGGAHTGGAADAVDVGFGVFGDVVVDDVGDFVDVDAAGGEVGGDEDVDFAGFEAAHDAFAFVLHEVAVDGGGGDAIVSEAGGDFVDAALGAAEDDGQRRFFLAEKHLEGALLVPGLDADVELGGFGVGELFVLGVGEDALGIAHVLGDHALDVFVDGGGDEHGLVRGAAEGEDFADVIAEADVEHAVLTSSQTTKRILSMISAPRLSTRSRMRPGECRR